MFYLTDINDQDNRIRTKLLIQQNYMYFCYRYLGLFHNASDTLGISFLIHHQLGPEYKDLFNFLVFSFLIIEKSLVNLFKHNAVMSYLTLDRTISKKHLTTIQ